VNTFISLCSSTISAFLISRLFDQKFDVVHIQNSTLAGGVVMGVAADQYLTIAGAMSGGFAAGAVSVLGYHFLQPKLSSKFNIQDVCGVNNLHGMPGILGAIIAIFSTYNAQYLTSVYVGDSDFNSMFPKGDMQAGYQAAALAITLGIAIVGGILTGFVMKGLGSLRRIIAPDFFNDRTFWNLPSDYNYIINTPSQDQKNSLEMNEV